MSMTEKLAYLKRRDKLTTEEVAARANLPVGTLNKVFSGQTKSPAWETMNAVCKVFGVPVHYVLDDAIPAGCSVDAYAETTGALLLSPEERNWLLDCRRLAPRERRCVEDLILQFLIRLPRPSEVPCERLIPCYEPPAQARRGFFTDAWHMRTLGVPVDQTTREADCAVVVINDELQPIYEPGDILAIRHQDCADRQLGVFLLNGEGHIRKLWKKRDEIKLVSVKSGDRDIRVGAKDELRVFGEVLGVIREYRRI